MASTTTTTTPAIVDVTVRRSTIEPSGWDVLPVWSGVDRPNVGGWVVTSEGIARRLERALLAGVVCTNPGIGTDVNGQTYPTFRSTVLARLANTDLLRLGF